jgi:nucleotide-binding universal stress UspA family protein
LGVPLYAGAYLPDIDWRPIEEQAAEVLAERLAGWQEKYPQVTVRRVIKRDRPSAALRVAARTAQLLVVGSRGRGGFAGLLLGSVSQALIHHAQCPVLVARPGVDRLFVPGGRGPHIGPAPSLIGMLCGYRLRWRCW